MEEYQKDLVRADLERKLASYNDVARKLREYYDFKVWLKKAIIENSKPRMIMFGTSKQALLFNFKEQINFPQKDFLEIIKCMECYTTIYDENFNSISYSGRAYYLDEEHPKFKKFMLSVGLLDCFKKGYLFLGASCYNMEGFISANGIKMKHSVRSLFDMHNSMNRIIIDNISTVSELVNSEYYVNSIIHTFDMMEQHGIDLIKDRVLQVLESEKSK